MLNSHLNGIFDPDHVSKCDFGSLFKSSNLLFWSKFEIKIWTKFTFSKQVHHVRMNSFKLFSGPKKRFPRSVVPKEPYLELFTEEERKPSEAVLKEKFGMDIPVQDSNPPTASNSVLKPSNVNLEMKRSSSMSLGASKLGRKSKGDFDIDLLT